MKFLREFREQSRGVSAILVRAVSPNAAWRKSPPDPQRVHVMKSAALQTPVQSEHRIWVTRAEWDHCGVDASWLRPADIAVQVNSAVQEHRVRAPASVFGQRAAIVASRSAGTQRHTFHAGSASAESLIRELRARQPDRQPSPSDNGAMSGARGSGSRAIHRSAVVRAVKPRVSSASSPRTAHRRVLDQKFHAVGDVPIFTADRHVGQWLLPSAHG